MTIAELFVKLGIKGGSETRRELAGVKEGMGEIKSMSLEAKAAILAAVYAFERMMSKSGQAGADLNKFGALTGLSTVELQKWQGAARQFGIAAESVSGSVMSVQNAMTNILMGKASPEGLGVLADTVGFDETQMRDTFYVMKKLQEFAQSNIGADIKRNILSGFGVDDGTASVMIQGGFNEKNFAKANPYSDKETKQLTKANAEWANLWDSVEKAFGHFNAKHGAALVSQLRPIVELVEKLAEAFVKLGERAKVFQAIGFAAQALTKALQLLLWVIGDSSGGKNKGETEKLFGKGWFSDLISWRDKMDGKGMDWLKGATSSGYDSFMASMGADTQNQLALSRAANGGGGGGDTTNVTMHNHIQVQDGTHLGQKLEHQVKKAHKNVKSHTRKN